MQGADSCHIPDIVKKPRAAHLSDGQLHEKRQLLFGDVYRTLHEVVKTLVRRDDVEDTCHSLTDYILANPTTDVLDFLTCPLVAFEVIFSAWDAFRVCTMTRCASAAHAVLGTCHTCILTDHGLWPCVLSDS